MTFLGLGIHLDLQVGDSDDESDVAADVGVTADIPGLVAVDVAVDADAELPELPDPGLLG
ncbi:MAG: hypothetical protein GEU95_26230 [Rhizobiales bacterium]|nr:hypothetical protein [Hyphomicrobiales bacterium]